MSTCCLWRLALVLFVIPLYCSCTRATLGILAKSSDYWEEVKTELVVIMRPIIRHDLESCITISIDIVMVHVEMHLVSPIKG